MGKAFQKNNSVAGILKQASNSSLSANTAIIKEIELVKIIENKLNKFSMKEEIEFEILKESIKRTGILQPVILTKNEDDTYTIIAGHRRIRASKAIEKETVPAIVKSYDNEENEALDLVETNLSARKLSVDDILSSIAIIENILKNKEITIDGKVNDYIGNMLNMSGKQVERYKALSNLIPEIKKKVDNKEIGMSSVTGIASMPKEQQEIALKEIKKEEEETGKPVNREQVKEIKKDIENIDKLIPELKQKVDNDNMNIKTASELSTLPKEKQKLAHEEIEKTEEKTGNSVDVEQAKEIKKKIENIEKENTEPINEKQTNEVKKSFENEVKSVPKVIESNLIITAEQKHNDDKQIPPIVENTDGEELEDGENIKLSGKELEFYKLQEDLEYNRKELTKHSRVIHYIYNELSKLKLASLEKIKDEINLFEVAGELPKEVEKEVEEFIELY